MAEPSLQPERSSLTNIRSRAKFVGRQREMAELTAALEIAEEHIISVNTVGNHVRSILNKTNAANRTEAAAYAALRGLTNGTG